MKKPTKLTKTCWLLFYKFLQILCKLANHLFSGVCRNPFSTVRTVHLKEKLLGMDWLEIALEDSEGKE